MMSKEELSEDEDKRPRRLELQLARWESSRAGMLIFPPTVSIRTRTWKWRPSATRGPTKCRPVGPIGIHF